MLSYGSKKKINNGMLHNNELLIAMVRDLEDTREHYHGYSYVRTMRNILIGKEDAVIAPVFKNKEYFGCIQELTLEELERIMDKMVKNERLDVIHTSHGKLYCTHGYHKHLCKKDK